MCSESPPDSIGVINSTFCGTKAPDMTRIHVGLGHEGSSRSTAPYLSETAERAPGCFQPWPILLYTDPSDNSNLLKQ